MSKSALKLSMVRVVCKAFKKRRVVRTQKLIIRPLVLPAGLCGWNIAEAGHMPAEVSPSCTGFCASILS